MALSQLSLAAVLTILKDVQDTTTNNTGHFFNIYLLNICIQLGAIDGPLPEALAAQGQYLQVAGMASVNGMMNAPGQTLHQQQHMGQGIPGVSLPEIHLQQFCSSDV